MRQAADVHLTDSLVAGPRVYDAFRENDKDAAILSISTKICAVGLLLIVLQVSHHLFDVPGLHYAWELFLSLCS